MEESIFDIKLMNKPPSRDCKGQHSANSSGLDNRTEGLTEINSRTLRITTNNPSSLVPLKRTIWIVLNLEHPLTGDDISARRSRNKIPSLILREGSNLLFHGGSPIWISKSGTVGLGYRRERRRVVQGRHAVTQLGACRHAVLINDGRHGDNTLGQSRGSSPWIWRPKSRQAVPPGWQRASPLGWQQRAPVAEQQVSRPREEAVDERRHVENPEHAPTAARSRAG
jgi:hypothetical protein